MNTFQQVKELIKAGHWVACKDRDGSWSVFMYVRSDGRLEGTTPEKDIETSLDSGLNIGCYNEYGFEGSMTTIEQLTEVIKYNDWWTKNSSGQKPPLDKKLQWKKNSTGQKTPVLVTMWKGHYVTMTALNGENPKIRIGNIGIYSISTDIYNYIKENASPKERVFSDKFDEHVELLQSLLCDGRV